MNVDETTPLEERFTSLLVAYDEALAAGTPPAAAGEVDTPPELHQRLTEGLECLELLERLWPRRGSALGTPSAERGSEPLNAGGLTPFPGAPAAAPPQGLPLTRLGRFQIRRELGRGSYGIVFLAYDPQVRREVALKVPRSEVLLTPEVRQRFIREARAAAALEHPNLVPVYEAGEEGPVCFIASAYCQGITLATWLKQRSELVPDRLAATLVAVLAGAVHHAHTRGIVHRDLKPSNILLESVVRSPWSVAKEGEATATGSGRETTDYGLNPKVTDFGLAKVFLEGVSGDSTPGCATQSGAIVGTPGYMAPEQAGGHSRDVGPAADVYSLGAILYELLTGRPPFQAETPLETLMLVRTQEPVSPARLRPKLRGDLQTICLKCLEKDARKRYASAAALTEDLRRFLAGETIQARPIRARERVMKWARRRPAVAALLVLVVFVTALGFGLVTWQWQRAEAASQVVADKARELVVKNYRQSVALAERELSVNNMGRAEEILDACPESLRDWEWHCLKRLRYRSFPALQRHRAAAYGPVFSPDGRYLASGARDGTVKISDVTTGKELLTRNMPNHDIRSVAYSPDGQCLVTAGLDGKIIVWSRSTGEVLQTLRRHTDAVNRALFSPDGKRIASSSWDKKIKLLELATGSEIYTFEGYKGASVVVGFRSDGRELVTCSAGRTVIVWDTTTGQKISFFDTIGWTGSSAISHDGLRLALGDMDGLVTVWDLATGQNIHRMTGHTLRVGDLAFSHDDRRLVSGGYDKTLRVWDTTTGEETLSLHGHEDSITGVTFSPNGQQLASASQDGAVKLWDATPLGADERNPQAVTLRAHNGRVLGVAFSPNSQRLASASWDGTVKVWDALTGQEALTLHGHTNHVWAVAFSPDGQYLASAGWDLQVRLWDASTGQSVRALPKSDPLHSVAFHPDGRLLVAGNSSGKVKVWDPATGEEVKTLAAHDKSFVLSVAFSPDGRRLATADRDGAVNVWDATTWKLLDALPGHQSAVRCVAFSPDSARLASASEDGTVKVWQVEAGEEILKLPHPDRVFSVAFSPDGRRLASGGWDQIVRIWDATTGEKLHTLAGHAGYVWSVAFSPDGKRLASASGYAGKGEIKLWDASLWDKDISQKKNRSGRRCTTR